MKRHYTHWTFEKIMQAAEGSTSRLDLYERNINAYRAAKKHDMLDAMFPTRFVREPVKIIAERFVNRPVAIDEGCMLDVLDLFENYQPEQIISAFNVCIKKIE